jgi:hypothetical protein
MWSIFGALPTFLFTILSGGIIFFFLVMKAYENAVALAGLVSVGVGMFFGGIGWVMVLGNYFESPWKTQDKDKKEEKKRPPVSDDQA